MLIRKYNANKCTTHDVLENQAHQRGQQLGDGVYRSHRTVVEVCRMDSSQRDSAWSFTVLVPAPYWTP